jgi:hypothetical protein
MEHAGVVEQNVEAAERTHRLFDGPAAVAGEADVGADEDRPAPGARSGGDPGN